MLAEEFLLGVLSIVLIDLVLAGDNACVIAMAVRRLPRSKRLLGIFLGAGLAVTLRVGLTAVASQLVLLPLLKLIGGILVFGIAVKLLRENVSCPVGSNAGAARSFWEAIKLIVVADVAMSTDNILAVAAVAEGNVVLLALGLGLSIPLVVGGSSFVCALMDRYPWVCYLAAALLGKVGAGLVLTDPFLERYIYISHLWLVTGEILGAVGVLLLARWLSKRH
ncbi:Integral membrane protein TerC [Ammonifex degensii KC4]|uniref:Integral membrane protein TerC n=1 Tax=Ammonifex degensii (strain DSM 10501 / KC4) TaxID=429009 RepID=C9RBU0_AMMDK|nr:Integral membrane protein TerC [Ammonifex degensii KC4]